MAADRFLLENALQIGHLDQFKPFRDWVAQQREYWRDALENQRDPDTLRQAQGRAQAYKEILDLFQQAPTLLEKKAR